MIAWLGHFFHTPIRDLPPAEFALALLCMAAPFGSGVAYVLLREHLRRRRQLRLDRQILEKHGSLW